MLSHRPGDSWAPRLGTSSPHLRQRRRCEPVSPRPCSWQCTRKTLRHSWTPQGSTSWCSPNSYKKGETAGSPRPWGCHATTLLQIPGTFLHLSQAKGCTPHPTDFRIFLCCLGMLRTCRHPASTAQGLLLPTWVHHGAHWARPETHLKSCSSPSFILPRLSCRRKGTSLHPEQEISCGSRL